MELSSQVETIRKKKHVKIERRKSVDKQTNRYSPTIEIAPFLPVDVNDDDDVEKEVWPLTKPKEINNDPNLETKMVPFKDKTPAAECPVKDEPEYTKVFQRFFADGISLKKEIVKKIQGLKGVESVGVGFSTEIDGYWPVIRVIADEETCKEMEQDKQRKTILIQKVTVALKDALTHLHSDTSWDEDELENTIEIVINYPLQAYELCSAGDVVETTYNGNQKKLGTMGYSVCHEVTIGADVYTSHYEIIGYHPVIPSHSEEFRQRLPPLPTTNTTLDTSVKYRYITKCDSDVAKTKSPPNDPLLVPTLLRATMCPQQAKNGFKFQKQHFGYTINICSEPAAPAPDPENKAELVVGKSGLVKFMMTNDEDEERSYEYNIVEKRKQDEHPCNIDIAVLKYTSDHQNVCSIEESFANLTAGEGVTLLPSSEIIWSGPPGQTLEERKGKVVYIKSGKVHLLSDRLIKFNDPPQPGEYPGYVWYLNPAHNINVPLGHSGAPVFLQSRNNTTFHLLGNLITMISASPVIFSLNMVRAEIATHHIDQILAEELPYMYLQDSIEEGMIQQHKQPRIKPEMIKRLKTYKQYLTWYSKYQSFSPLIEDRYIRCELKICIHPHRSNNTLEYI